MAKIRPDHVGAHRGEFERNKRIILKTQNICAICGRAVDFSVKFPHPLSPTVDHIIPVAKGGHPSDIDNLQLAHFSCNRAKWDKLYDDPSNASPQPVTNNRILPLSRDWSAYRSEE